VRGWLSKVFPSFAGFGETGPKWYEQAGKFSTVFSWQPGILHFVTEELPSRVDKKGLLEGPNMVVVAAELLGTKDIVLVRAREEVNVRFPLFLSTHRTQTKLMARQSMACCLCAYLAN
jgi:hypothetical protein